MGVGPPWVCHPLVPQAQSSWVLGLLYEVYIFFCTSIGSVRNWSKAGGYIVFVFTFIWICLQKIRKTNHWIFQICRDCDHKTIFIPKLIVLYQISLSEDFKNIFLFIIMWCNHEKMFVWNASIWVGGPCTLRSLLNELARLIETSEAKATFFYWEEISSDESEPSWKIFSSARLVTFFHSARNQKLAKTSWNFDFEFDFFFS